MLKMLVTFSKPIPVQLLPRIADIVKELGATAVFLPSPPDVVNQKPVDTTNDSHYVGYKDISTDNSPF